MRDNRTRKIVFAIVGLLVVATLALSAGIVYSAKKQQAPELSSPANFVGSAFQVPSAANNSSAKRVDVVFDPHCPGCRIIDRALSGTLKEMNDNGEIALYLTPVSFLDQASTDNYSSRAANAFIEVAVNEPDRAYDFLTKLMSSDFQPREGSGYQEVDNAKLAWLAVGSEVSQRTADKFSKESYVDWVRSNTQHVFSDTELYSDGRGFTPLVLIGKGTSNAVKVDFSGVNSNEDIVSAFKDALNR